MRAGQARQADREHNSKGAAVLTNATFADAVVSSINLDPRIPHPVEVAVAADGESVILRGTVESFAQRRAAEQDAKQVDGVEHVHDELTVNLLGGWRRGDDEIKGIALQNLIWDVEVPSDSVKVHVEEGWVTLKGEVQYQFQNDAAFNDVATLYGVVGVTNDIKVVTP
jgi:osmotically-inducible protein OsmY